MIRELEPSVALARGAREQVVPTARARPRDAREQQKWLAIGAEGGKRDRAKANGGRLTVADRLDRALEFAESHGGAPHTPLNVLLDQVRRFFTVTKSYTVHFT